jgi:hypothetical protein
MQLAVVAAATGLLSYCAIWTSGGALADTLAEISELYWVGVAALFGVSGALWTVGIGLFSSLDRAIAARGPDQGRALAAFRPDFVALVQKIADAGAAGALVMAASLVLAVAESIDATSLRAPAWYIDARPDWGAAAVRMALFSVVVRLLWVQFRAMRAITGLFASLAAPVVPALPDREGGGEAR